MSQSPKKKIHQEISGSCLSFVTQDVPAEEFKERFSKQYPVFVRHRSKISSLRCKQSRTTLTRKHILDKRI